MKLASASTHTPMPPLHQQPFSDAQCEALFAALLVHDDLHLHAQLPDVVHLDYSKEQLEQCYFICHQLWRDGVDRGALALIIKTIRTQHVLAPELQIQFKDMRAKFKQLRFAFATFDARHRYPRSFHWLIASMGYLQDAIKNDQHDAVQKATSALAILLHKAPYALMTRSLEQFRPASNESFRQHIAKGIAGVEAKLALPTITGREFHAARIIISRMVALYDNLKILYPSPYHDSISQYLSTINGMMGKMHDELVARQFDKTHDYDHDATVIPDAIRTRLLTLVSRFKGPSSAQ